MADPYRDYLERQGLLPASGPQAGAPLAALAPAINAARARSDAAFASNAARQLHGPNPNLADLSRAVLINQARQALPVLPASQANNLAPAQLGAVIAARRAAQTRAAARRVADLAARANQAPPGSVRPPAASAPITPFLPPLNDLGMDNQRVQHPYQQGQGALDRLAALRQSGRPPVANPDRLIANDLAGPEALLAEQAPTPESFAAQLARVQQARNLAAAEERRINELTAAGRDPRERDPDAMWGVAEYARDVTNAGEAFIRDVTNAGEAFIRDPSKETALGLVGTAYQPFDWGRQHVGRPIAGELLYQLAERKNLSRAIAAIPGVGAPVLALEAIMTANPGFRQRVIDAHQRGGPVAVWEDAVAGAADDWHPALRALYLGVADFVIDPLGLLLAAATGGGAAVAKTAAREAAEQSAALAARRAAGELVTEGIRPATRAKALLGDVLQTPQRVLDVTADAPFTAAGALGRRALGPLAQPSRASGERLAQEEAARSLNLAARALTRAPTSPVDISAATVFPAERPLALPEPAWRVSPRGDVVPPGGGPPPPRGAPEVWPVEAAVRDARTPPRPAEADVPAGPWEPTRDGGVRTRVRYYGSRSQFGTRVVDQGDGTFSVQKRQKNLRYQPLPGMTGLDEATADQAARRVVLREQGKLPEGTALVEPVPEQAPLPEPTPAPASVAPDFPDLPDLSQPGTRYWATAPTRDPERLATWTYREHPEVHARIDQEHGEAIAAHQARVDAIQAERQAIQPGPPGSLENDRINALRADEVIAEAEFQVQYGQWVREAGIEPPAGRPPVVLRDPGKTWTTEARVARVIYEPTTATSADRRVLYDRGVLRPSPPANTPLSYERWKRKRLTANPNADVSEARYQSWRRTSRARDQAAWERYQRVERAHASLTGEAGLSPARAATPPSTAAAPEPTPTGVLTVGPSRKVSSESGGGTLPKRSRRTVLRDGEPTDYELDGTERSGYTIVDRGRTIRGKGPFTKDEALAEIERGIRDVDDLPPGAVSGQARVGFATGADALSPFGRGLRVLTEGLGPAEPLPSAVPFVGPVVTEADELARLGRIDLDDRAMLNQTLPDVGTLHVVGAKRPRGAPPLTRANFRTRTIDGVTIHVPRGTRPTSLASVNRGRITAADLYDQFVDDLKAGGFTESAAHRTALREVVDLIAEHKGIVRAEDRSRLAKTLGKALAVWDAVNRFSKEGVQYNAFRWLNGPFTDMIGDGFKAIVTGEPGIAARQLRLDYQRRIFRNVRNNVDDWWRGLDAFQIENDLDLAMPRSRGIRAETPVDEGTLLSRIEHRAYGRDVASRVFADPRVRDWRQAGDDLRRALAAHAAHQRELPHAIARFQRRLERRAEQTGANLADWWNGIHAEAARNGRGTFNAEDVLRATADEQAARAWRGEINLLKKLGREAHESRFFTYRQTNLDAALSRFVFFHYWLSRETALHARAALRNPALLGAYWRLFEGINREAEREGYPSSVTGLFRFLTDGIGGWYAYFDPIGLIVPDVMFRMAGGADDQSAWDKIDLFLSPMVGAALAVAGKTDQRPDLTGSYKVRQFVRLVAAWMEDNGYAPAMARAVGSPAAFVDRAQLAILERLNQGARDLGLTDADFEPWDPLAAELDAKRSILREKIAEDLGVSSGSAFDRAYLDAEQALRVDPSSNPYAAAAEREYNRGQLGQFALGAVLPGGRVRFGARDDRLALADAGRAKLAEGAAWDELPPEEQRAIEERGIDTSAEPALETLADQFHAIGTPNQQLWAEVWTKVAYGELEPWEWVELNGQRISGWEVMHLSDRERIELANAVIAQDDAEWNASEELAAYWAERDAFIAAHPEYGDYDEYRDAAYGYDGGVAAFRRDALPNHPEFAQELADREAYLRDQGKTGAILDAELDQWTVSTAGYHAFFGRKDSLYDEDPLPAYDPTADPLTPMLAKPSDEPGAFSRPVAKGYAQRVRDDLNAFMIQMEFVASKLGGVDPSRLNPMMRPHVEKLIGGPLPEKSRLLTLYEQWAAAQPAGSDASPEAFERYLNDLDRRQRLGLLPEDDNA